jgi:hypothetical protein
MMIPGVRSLNRLLFVLLAVLVAMVALAPRLLSRPAARNWLLASTLPVDGKVTAEASRLGWLSPLHFENVEITDPQGRPAIRVGTIDGDRPLWRVVLHRSTPGTFRLQKVQVDVFTDPEGTNLSRLIDRRRLRHATLGLELVDGVLVFHQPGASAWSLGPFQLTADLQDGEATGSRELVIHPGTLLSKATIAAPKSSDVLQYAMPVLAEANIAGQISLQIDGWRLPLETPEKSTGKGRLVIHQLDVEAGPLARTLGELLGNRAPLRLAQDTTVPFSMADGRIYHQDLRFGLQGVALCTRGSVGVSDQSLDVVAEVEFPRDPSKSRPLLDAVQKLSIPIRGTLTQPMLDRAGLRDSGKQMLRDALDGLLRRRP